MEGLLSPWHLLIVFVVAVVVFGPHKLPEIGRQVGRGVQGELPPGHDPNHKPALPDTSD